MLIVDTLRETEIYDLNFVGLRSDEHQVVEFEVPMNIA